MPLRLLSLTVLGLLGLQLVHGMGWDLAYDRDLINAGQWWRLLSGQLVHSNWPHWLMNVLALSMLCSLFDGSRQWLLLPVAALGNSLALYVFEPQLLHYVGLSAVLHTLFVVGAAAQLSRNPAYASLLLLALLGKLLNEQLMGGGSQVEAMIGMRVAAEAHLWGALLGMLLAMTISLRAPASLWLDKRQRLFA